MAGDIDYVRYLSMQKVKNKVRIDVISNDTHFDGTVIKNKGSAEFKFETA